jgi:hypothetical protein
MTDQALKEERLQKIREAITAIREKPGLSPEARARGLKALEAAYVREMRRLTT